jgi:thiosulfate/3-mercaptopyruvate sulfurtransferase
MKYRIVVILICVIAVGFDKYGRKAASVRDAKILYHNAGKNSKSLKGKGNNAISTEPWTADQLMAPAELAELITNPKAGKPVIICVGPGAAIRGSLDMGPAKEKENLEKYKLLLSRLSKDADIVIYCGCCPFEHCPNIRPAFTLLNEMKFTNAHLLNLEHNIKTDWIAKGYPQ